VRKRPSISFVAKNILFNLILNSNTDPLQLPHPQLQPERPAAVSNCFVFTVLEIKSCSYGGIDEINEAILSNEVAEGTFLFFLDDWLHLFLDDYPHGLVEDSLETFLGKRTALHVFALELLLDDFPGGFLHDRGLLGILFVHCELLPQVDFIPDEDLRDVPDVLLEFGVPLRRLFVTFLRALTKEEG